MTAPTEIKFRFSHNKMKSLLQNIEALQKMPVADVADLLTELEDEHIAELLPNFRSQYQGLIFSDLPMVRQLCIFR